MKDRSTGKNSVRVGSSLDFASREAYNLLRTNISFAFPDAEGGRIVGVSSSCPKEGKSTTSVNLAYSLAESGKKVLLIDGDMRRPSINEILDLSLEPGLSDVLAGKTGIVETKGVLHEGMSVLSAGHIPPNPSELIGSHRMQTLLEDYRQKYDYIVIDLPPILSVSDPIAVSKYIGGMIIVVRHEKTGRREIAETIRQLEYAKVKILGFVYNRVGEKSVRGKYGKKSKYGYNSK